MPKWLNCNFTTISLLLRAALAVCSAIRTNKKTSFMPIKQSLVSGALSKAHGARAGMTADADEEIHLCSQ